MISLIIQMGEKEAENRMTLDQEKGLVGHSGVHRPFVFLYIKKTHRIIKHVCAHTGG